MPKSMPLFKSGLTFILFLLVAGGCTTMQFGRYVGRVVGVWKFKDPQNGPQTLTFKKDGTFEVDTDGNGAKNIWGSYRLSQDWLILNDVGGETSLDCGQEGAYVYGVSKNDENLSFTLMADQCPPRIQALSVEWTRIHKKMPPPIQIKI